MDFYKYKIIIACIIIVGFSRCDNYELCTETPEIDTKLAFRIVDENGKDLAYNKIYVYPIIKLLDADENNIIRSYQENDEAEQAFFYLQTFNDLSFFNNKDYVLQYAFSDRDTIQIDAEWTENICGIDYSKVNSIRKGTKTFKKVDGVFLIIKD
jgi:hypothetical protein